MVKRLDAATSKVADESHESSNLSRATKEFICMDYI